MSKVLCLGELLLRISFDQNRSWGSNAHSHIYLGGSELNVATALALWSIPAKYCTAIPDNYMSREIIEQLNIKGIDTSSIIATGDRVGLYYLPQNADLKHTDVIYDRANSSFAGLKPGVIPWSDVLKDCSWLHFSAITPALNASVAAVCKEALQVAAGMGITISVDLNYRAKLWQKDIHAPAVMGELLPYCNLVMGNMWAAENLLGIKSSLPNLLNCSKEEMIVAAENSIQQVQKAFPKVRNLAYTFRLEHTYFGILKQGETLTMSKEFALQNIVDPVGSGDCFIAGLIYGLSQQHHAQQIVDFAAAAAVGKLSEHGDATHQTISSILHRITIA